MFPADQSGHTFDRSGASLPNNCGKEQHAAQQHKSKLKAPTVFADQTKKSNKATQVYAVKLKHPTEVVETQAAENTQGARKSPQKNKRTKSQNHQPIDKKLQ